MSDSDPPSPSDPGSLLRLPAEWRGPSADPNDEQFGHVVDVATLDRADEYDLVLVGEPYDGAVIGRRGARGGPAAIREELAGVKTTHFEVGPVAGDGDETPAVSVADLGDVRTEGDLHRPDDVGSLPNDTAGVQDRVATVAGALHRTRTTPVFLGGDNSLTVGNVRPLVEAAHEAGDRVGVVNFDAHLDVREPRDGPTSGTPYRQLLDGEEGGVEGGGGALDGYVVVGARHFETSTTYADYVDDVGGSVITSDALAAGTDTVGYRIASATADLDRLYVSVDLDVLDASVAPGVSAPTPGGLRSRDLFDLVRSLASDERVAGFELVETAPALDPASSADSPQRNRTVAAAARTVAHFAAGFAERNAPEGEGGDR